MRMVWTWRKILQFFFKLKKKKKKKKNQTLNLGDCC